MFIIRVLSRPAEGKPSEWIRDEEVVTRREAVARVRALGTPGQKFLEGGRTVRTVFVGTAKIGK